VPAAFDRAYRDSDVIFFEAYIDASVSPHAESTITRLGMLGWCGNLRHHITEHTYDAVEAYLLEMRNTSPNPVYDALLDRKHGFQKYSPGLLAMTLSSIAASEYGVSPDYGLESYLAKKAHRDGKPIGGLEPPTYQMRLLKTLNRAEADRLLRITMKNATHADWYFDSMISSWKSGNLSRMKTLIANDYPADNALTRKLIQRRNANWLPTIEAMLQGTEIGNSMFVVGAAHVLGPGSVIELLEAKGYRVKQLY